MFNGKETIQIQKNVSTPHSIEPSFPFTRSSPNTKWLILKSYGF